MSLKWRNLDTSTLDGQFIFTKSTPFPIKDIGIVFPTFYILLDGFEYNNILFCYLLFKIHENSKISEKVMRQKCFE